MNSAHWHLLIAHAPIAGAFFGLCLLLLGLLKRSEELKRTSLLVFIFTALLAWPTHQTGPLAAAMLRRVAPGIPLDPSDQHSEIAVLALAGILVLGFVSLIGLLFFRKGRNLPKAYLAILLLLALGCSGLMGWTANLGARIRHPEIHTN